MIGLYRVHGDSMSPSLLDGDYVVTWRASSKRLRPGRIVVVDHLRFGRIVKRIERVTTDGYIRLVGDNPVFSTSTDAIGDVTAKSVRGVVIHRIRRPARKATNA